MNRRAILKAVPLFFAAALAAAVLLTVWLFPTRAWQNDTESYVATAQALLSGDGFSIGGRPELFRTPGYPLLVAVGALAGNFWFVSLIQFLLIAATVWFCVDAAKLLNPKLTEIPFFKWCLLLLTPHFFAYPALLLSETLFAFLLTASVRFGAKWRKTRSRADLAASVLLLAVLPLVRPVGLVAVALYGLFLLARCAKHAKRRGYAPAKRALLLTAVALCCAAPSLLWAARNEAVGDAFAVSTVSAHNLYHYTAARVQAVREHRSDEEVRAERDNVETRWVFSNPEATRGELARWNKREGLRYLTESPVVSALVYLESDAASLLPEASGLCELFGITTGNKGTLAVLHQSGPMEAARHYFGEETAAVPIVLWSLLWSALFLLTLAQAVWVTLWRPVPWLWIFALVGLAFVLVPGPVSCPRFLFPALPLFHILILAANDDVAPRRSGER